MVTLFPHESFPGLRFPFLHKDVANPAKNIHRNHKSYPDEHTGVMCLKNRSFNIFEVRQEKTDLKVFVIPKEGWARVAAPILLLV